MSVFILSVVVLSLMSVNVTTQGSLKFGLNVIKFFGFNLQIIVTCYLTAIFVQSKRFHSLTRLNGTKFGQDKMFDY
jgi:hypothetical protein